MISSLQQLYTKLCTLLTARGFTPMKEFSAVDSLIHANEMLGVISFEGSQTVAQALTYLQNSFCIETDHKLCLHLYGKSGSFVDYETLSSACYDLFYDIVKDPDLLICKMEMSKAVQSMPLQRLERKIEFTLRVSETSEVQ